MKTTWKRTLIGTLVILWSVVPFWIGIAAVVTQKSRIGFGHYAHIHTATGGRAISDGVVVIAMGLGILALGIVVGFLPIDSLLKLLGWLSKILNKPNDGSK